MGHSGGSGMCQAWGLNLDPNGPPLGVRPGAPRYASVYALKSSVLGLRRPVRGAGRLVMAPRASLSRILWSDPDFRGGHPDPHGAPRGLTQYRPFRVKLRVILAAMMSASKSGTWGYLSQGVTPDGCRDIIPPHVSGGTSSNSQS